MRIWMIKVGELLPIDGARYRPHRVGMLADALLERGHELVWWAATLDHSCKQQRFTADTTVRVNERYTINLIHTAGYRRNVSVRRLVDHAQLAQKFARQIENSSRPDIIYCCFPTIELSCAAVEFGRRHNIPVVLDVRDLWPENFLSVVPRRARALARLALRPYIHRTHCAFEGCTSVVGISEDYLRYGLRYARRERTERDGVFPLGYPRPANGIGNGPEDERVLTSLRTLGVDPTKQICWFVGMFGRTYDLPTVIQAARRFALRGNTDVQFVLSGTGDNHRALCTLAERLPNVVFTGRIDAPQVLCMGRIASVGLMAYATGAPQGLPNKLFEYMSAGLPIVSSLQGETSAVLTQHACGLTYEPADPESLTACLDNLLQNTDLRHRMGDSGRDAFDRFYASDRIYSRLAVFLEQFGLSKDSNESIVDTRHAVTHATSLCAA